MGSTPGQVALDHTHTLHTVGHQAVYSQVGNPVQEETQTKSTTFSNYPHNLLYYNSTTLAVPTIGICNNSNNNTLVYPQHAQQQQYSSISSTRTANRLS